MSDHLKPSRVYPAPTFIVERVIVVGRGVYRCGCGTSELGDGCKVELGVLPAQADLSKLAQPHGMPIGWASYGNGNYRCPRCKT